MAIAAVAYRGETRHVKACRTALYALMRMVYGGDVLSILGFSASSRHRALQARDESLSRFGPDAPRVVILADVRGQRADLATKLTMDGDRVRLHLKPSPTPSGYMRCTERVELMVSARDWSITCCKHTEHENHVRMSRKRTLQDMEMGEDVVVSWLEVINIRHASSIRFLIWVGRQLTVVSKAQSFWDIYRTFILPLVLDNRGVTSMQRRERKARIYQRPLASVHAEIT